MLFYYLRSHSTINNPRFCEKIDYFYIFYWTSFITLSLFCIYPSTIALSESLNIDLLFNKDIVLANQERYNESLEYYDKSSISIQHMLMQ